ncbi:MAG: AbrB/MazE/SpoVT family DNA-binding domain-containing protein [Cyanosarcina radialis HA8281-LM2]|jgi:AbrB family looped-hinge helix DNA binding protein|nr:AbrB/MazE/SpoVT family DNA-binding domain-containing protein [Cyanosarcina radialis HA8281-LM2]
MTDTIVSVNEQGRIVIPARLREQLGLEPGAKLVARLDGNRIILERPAEVLKQLRSTFNSPDSLVDELIADRRTEFDNE